MARWRFAVLIGLAVVATTVSWSWRAIEEDSSRSQPPSLPPRASAAEYAESARLSGVDSVPAPSTPAATAEGALRLTAILPAFGAEPSDVALIAVGDEPPRPFRRGATIKDDLYVQDVGSQTVQLASRQTGDVIVLALSANGRIMPAASVAVHDRISTGSATAASEAHFDASPIVPPHPEMTAPRAADAGTPGSYWARMREGNREDTTGSVERAERGQDPARR